MVYDSVPILLVKSLIPHQQSAMTVEISKAKATLGIEGSGLCGEVVVRGR